MFFSCSTIGASSLSSSCLRSCPDKEDLTDRTGAARGDLRGSDLEALGASFSVDLAILSADFCNDLSGGRGGFCSQLQEEIGQKCPKDKAFKSSLLCFITDKIPGLKARTE